MVEAVVVIAIIIFIPQPFVRSSVFWPRRTVLDRASLRLRDPVVRQHAHLALSGCAIREPAVAQVGSVILTGQSTDPFWSPQVLQLNLHHMSPSCQAELHAK
jgi:hypothetical protein